ncbi:MAG: sigma-70 family RNA polymerase sigma factor [Chloroflexota bacterium]|nr:sigma-70 family RNA polymerase sigma factor [Chloroflexota bacterium]
MDALTDLDQQSFEALVEQHRHELHMHCYRMVGSLHDAEDMVQETFLKAWRGRMTYEGRASLRAWLYKIATNTCLDALRKQPRRFVPMTLEDDARALDLPIPASVMEPIWLQPYPDYALDTISEESVIRQEHTRLAFIVALQVLPPRQRAVLILRDVLEWQASEVATLLDMSVAAVKSALHRARATLAERAGDDTHMDANGDAALLERYVRAWESADIDGLVRLLHDDATFSMPPIPSWYRGAATIRDLTAKTIFAGQAHGRWRLLPTRANRQIAFGLYRQSDTPGVHAAYGIQVVTFRGERIADILTFRDPALMPYFRLAAVLEG